MTDPTPTDEPTTDLDVTPEDVTPAVEDQDAEPDADNANTEAAKYRRRLRDTETQLSTTTERLTAYQRRHAEQILGDVLATPADLFDVGQADLAEFLDDNGDVHTDELIAAAAALVAQRPQLGANYTPPIAPGYDFGNGVRSQSAESRSTWAKALAPERRR